MIFFKNYTNPTIQVSDQLIRDTWRHLLQDKRPNTTLDNNPEQFYCAYNDDFMGIGQGDCNRPVH